MPIPKSVNLQAAVSELYAASLELMREKTHPHIGMLLVAVDPEPHQHVDDPFRVAICYATNIPQRFREALMAQVQDMMREEIIESDERSH